MSKNKWILAASLAALSLSACVVAPPPRPYVAQPVMVAPPPPRVEVVTVAPSPGYVWIGGYWGWVGSRHEWVPGHWEAPRPGYRYVPHRWDHDGPGWREHHGHWER